jgi:hypothetical protein
MTIKPSVLRAHYARLARLWPADPLRPHLPFQRLLLGRREDPVLSPPPSITGAEAPTTADADAVAKHARDVNALYALLDDRFARKVRPLLLFSTTVADEREIVAASRAHPAARVEPGALHAADGGH